MLRKSAKPKVDNQAIISAFLTNRVQQKLMQVFFEASDEELQEYGTRFVAILTFLIKWAQKAMVGFASTSDLEPLFYSDHVPLPAQALIKRIIAML